MNIAILGCGPAGLLAAHACVRRGHQPTVYSKPVMSPHGGAQYLHQPIPGITQAADDPEMLLRYVKLGDHRGYAEKVYGDPDAPVSWHHFHEGVVPAWSMGMAYRKLWDEYSELIVGRELGPHDVDQMVAAYELVISTIPRKVICHKPDVHEFNSQLILLEEAGQLNARNVIVYNGQPTERWYRTSNINGTAWTEYAVRDGYTEQLTPDPNREIGFKPIDHTCDCHPTVVKVGRFGKWRKAVLSHSAFADTNMALVMHEAADVVQ